MVTRPASIPDTREAMRKELQSLGHRGETTPCADAPVLYTDTRQSPDDAKELCGRDTDTPCPLLELCAQLGFTESVYADDMVYGGYTWRRGLPLVSEEAFEQKRQRGELKRLNARTHAADTRESTYA